MQSTNDCLFSPVMTMSSKLSGNMSSQVGGTTSSVNKLSSPFGITGGSTTSFVSPCGGIGSPNQSSMVGRGREEPPTMLTSSIKKKSKPILNGRTWRSRVANNVHFIRIMREYDSNWFAGWEKELPSQLQLPSSQANSRVVWSQQLHERFLDAVEHLGINHAVPKRIMEFMDVDGLTRVE
ncbi:hypothetical protein HID58_011186, partial [Brassica napus]